MSKPRLIWERTEPTRRASPAPLSRDRIVRTAIQLADAKGLEAVSLRNIAAKLGVGPMRLYGYVAAKQDLLELMVDAVQGEPASAARSRADWRRALRAIANQVRDAALAHPWLVELLGGRPRLGPHALAQLEATLAVLNGIGGTPGIDAVLQAAGTFDAYVLGAIRTEIGERRDELTSGKSKPEWQAAAGQYLQRLVATGKFPMLDRVMREASHPGPDVRFERGLDCVLDGIASRLLSV
ncbi:MAG TPA: TetR/AcrR family transcriptional regulator [Polyangia bacterium]|nr:TetR/AcrR family transcriptional regulator [Polyangia bacterium]